ncbi:hypothetical protein TWF694_005352 [Orbilia ellipsospora]|uniref:F-box domain-containing protein n=1 Tax=Orbilia ellipsospora TaxID=2528407 RepID=A0AAV9WTX7_9PEZI
MDTCSLSLTTLPIDILAYLIYDIIPDDRTLITLSCTSRSFRHLCLRRLRSEKVVLDFNLAGHVALLKDNVASDIFSLSGYRSVGLTKSLLININSLENQDLAKFEQYQSFLSDAARLLHQFQNVTSVTLREATWLDNDHPCDLVGWAEKVLKLPKLKHLYLDPCGRHLFRASPDDEHLAHIEKQDQAGSRKGEKGLEILSVQTVSNNIYHFNYSQFTELIKTTLASNIRSLNRLWFNGLEFTEALEQLPDGCLAEMRLKSLSLRRLGNHEEMVRVFSLQPRGDPNSVGASEIVDTMTSLEHLYLSDGTHLANAELQLLRYLRTPKLKSLQLGGRIFHPVVGTRRVLELLFSYLNSFSSLERFGTSRVDESSKAIYGQILEIVSTRHMNLKTLAAWYTWYAASQILTLRPIGPGVKVFQRLEIMCKSTSGDQGIFWALGQLFRCQSSQTENLTTLCIGDKLWEQEYFAAREICVIISTILYIQNKRDYPSHIFSSQSDDEDEISPRTDTPGRQALASMIESGRKAKYNNLLRVSPQRQAVVAYLDSLSFLLEEIQCKWLSKLADWDSTGIKNKEEVVRGMQNAVYYSPPEGFRRLEVRLKERATGRKWPNDVRDRSFVWEKKYEFGWDIVEYL